MSELRYPALTIWPDYLRAGIVAGISIALLTLLDASGWVRAVLALVLALSAMLAYQGWRRQRTRVLLDDDGIALQPGTAALRWADLDRLRLAYYRLGRENRGGWFELHLGAGRQRISVDSRLHGFDQVLRRAVAAARSAGIAVDPATAANVDVLERAERGDRREPEPASR